jgi:hypothetical protein
MGDGAEVRDKDQSCMCAGLSYCKFVQEGGGRHRGGSVQVKSTTGFTIQFYAMMNSAKQYTLCAKNLRLHNQVQPAQRVSSSRTQKESD